MGSRASVVKILNCCVPPSAKCFGGKRFAMMNRRFSQMFNFLNCHSAFLHLSPTHAHTITSITSGSTTTAENHIHSLKLLVSEKMLFHHQMSFLPCCLKTGRGGLIRRPSYGGKNFHCVDVSEINRNIIEDVYFFVSF